MNEDTEAAQLFEQQLCEQRQREDELITRLRIVATDFKVTNDEFRVECDTFYRSMRTIMKGDENADHC